MKIGYFSGKDIKNNVSYFLETNSNKNPDKPMFYWVNPELLKPHSGISEKSFNHQSMSYKEFTTITSRIASGYIKLGIKHGDRVILFVPMTVSLYLAMSALQRIGAIPVFLDSWTRHIHMGTAIQQVQPKAIISFEKAFMLLSSISGLISIKISVGPTINNYTTSLEELMQNASQTPIFPVEQEDTALITFTTGSSGVPKGADRSHRFLAAQHYALKECIPYQENDIDLPIFPVFSLNNIASGISTVLPAIDIGIPKSSDSQILLSQIKNCNVNSATLSPSIFNNLAKLCIENNLKIPQLKRVVTGGAPISRSNIQNFKTISKNAAIVVLYGSTEVEPISQIKDSELLSIKSHEDKDEEWVDEGVNVGHIVKGLKFKLIKIDKNPIKINSQKDWKQIEIQSGDVGELIVSGEHVCQKYYKNQEAFERAKIVDVNGTTIWHRTGDLVRIDKDGYFWIVGRVHNAIKRDGIYLFPVRAEVVLKKLSFVIQAAYLGVPDSKIDEQAVVVIEPKDKTIIQSKDTKKLEVKIRNVLSKNNLPVDSIIFLESIPMDSRHHSKVEYTQLRKQITETI